MCLTIPFLENKHKKYFKCDCTNSYDNIEKYVHIKLLDYSKQGVVLD